MIPVCHENFTRMSFNSPTTSCEIGCGQSVLGEKCVQRTLFWLIKCGVSMKKKRVIPDAKG